MKENKLTIEEIIDKTFEWFCSVVASSADPKSVENAIELYVNDCVTTHYSYQLTAVEKDEVIKQVIKLYG